ncbi:hypothetical protein Q8F55_001687 [Vanrija albida]|uniref:Uncharacterized protein n=1 Tax=Vanrija albida TaxID=181172 RepID=A0ABR3Q7M7_9TREE
MGITTSRSAAHCSCPPPQGRLPPLRYDPDPDSFTAAVYDYILDRCASHRAASAFTSTPSAMLGHTTITVGLSASPILYSWSLPVPNGMVVRHLDSFARSIVSHENEVFTQLLPPGRTRLAVLRQAIELPSTDFPTRMLDEAVSLRLRGGFDVRAEMLMSRAEPVDPPWRRRRREDEYVRQELPSLVWILLMLFLVLGLSDGGDESGSKSRPAPEAEGTGGRPKDAAGGRKKKRRAASPARQHLGFFQALEAFFHSDEPEVAD